MQPSARERLATAIEAVCNFYVTRFGTPTVFALSLVGLVLWLGLIPVMGFWHWNNTAGLLANSLESTGEWFFAVGTLVIARSIDERQRQQQEAMRHQIEAIATRDRYIELLERSIAEHLGISAGPPEETD
ncbi:hypothetical protein [Streptomyces sp. NPDC093261]|uniref:hypothetical protein n=1 Tax=Streptomyces sp. NPDC093261 TaxID=3366037 RepID=UPI0037FF7D92